MRKNCFILLLGSLIIAFTIAIAFNVWIPAQSKITDIILSVRVIDDKGQDITNKIYLQAQIWIIPPPNRGKDYIEIFRGSLGPEIRISSKNRLLISVMKEWIRFLKDMNVSRKVIESYMTALGVALWVINRTDNTVIYRYFDFIPVSPLNIVKGLGKHHEIIIRIDGELKSAKKVKVGPCDGGTCEWVLIWERQWIRRPEDNPSVFGSDKRVVNGVVYVKTPILFIYNALTYSGVIQSSIILKYSHTTYFRASFALSYRIEAKLKSGDWTGGLDGKIKVISSTVSLRASMGDIITVSPNQKKYVYIWTHPVVSFWKEKKIKCCGAECYDGEYTGYEKIVGYADSILVRGSRISHGVSSGDLPQWMRRYFYNAVRERFVTSLDPNDTILLSDLIRENDKYNTNIEKCISLALLSLLVPGHFARLVGAFSIALSYGESVNVTIEGVLKNVGEYGGQGFNVTELVYLKVSRLRYTYNGYIFRVPFGLYFKCY